MPIEGFDTEPNELDDFDIDRRKSRFDRRDEADYEKTLPGPAEDRRENDARTDRRLFALKRHIEGMQSEIHRLHTAMKDVVTKDDLATNTELTKKVLDILNGGKLLTSIFKFAASLAVPIAAIATAWHVIFNGGSPK